MSKFEGYVRNCDITMRNGDGTLFDATTGRVIAYLDGYTILPKEDYAAKTAECERLERELDMAAPLTRCARCGNQFRWYQMVPEEGDEWECIPCNDRENARERAEIAKAAP